MKLTTLKSLIREETKKILSELQLDREDLQKIDSIFTRMKHDFIANIHDKSAKLTHQSKVWRNYEDELENIAKEYA